jgi:transposase-like protein
MTVMESGSEILKVDEVGRVRTPLEKREAMLAEYERSGMTGAQFARFVGVRYSTLMYWLQKGRKGAGKGQEKASSRNDHPRWLEAQVEEGAAAKSENLVVEMGAGVRILVSNRRQAALAGEVLRAIGLGRGC